MIQLIMIVNKFIKIIVVIIYILLPDPGGRPRKGFVGWSVGRSVGWSVTFSYPAMIIYFDDLRLVKSFQIWYTHQAP